jgi:hypothetical protein
VAAAATVVAVEAADIREEDTKIIIFIFFFQLPIQGNLSQFFRFLFLINLKEELN